jgi:multiple sugar transport system substrate-binding protein
MLIMPTMKDIAHLAGVSHGTVSNVLNGKGNVCLEKIKLVEDAAAQLGYTVNKQAKNLRKSVADIFVIILPCLRTQEYVEFYDAVRQYAENSSYRIQLHLTDNIPSKELDIIKNLDVERICGIAVITCLDNKQVEIYSQLTRKSIKVIFVERKPQNADFCYVGFDFKQAGMDIAHRISDQFPGITSIGLFTLSSAYSSEDCFVSGIKDSLDASFFHVKTDMQLAFTHAFSFFERDNHPEVIVTTHSQLALELQKAYKILGLESPPCIISLTPVNFMSHGGIMQYSLNYGHLGHAVCSQMLESPMAQKEFLLQRDGFARKYNVSLVPRNKTINVITLNSPSTHALTQLAPAFTRKTGIEVNFAVFSHDELYDIINEIKNYSYYDVIRLDVAWLPWFAEKALLELDFDNMGFEHIQERFVPNALNNFSIVNGKHYALPFDLSIQLLFYRKDLYEDPRIKRMYYEHTKSSLQVPQNYREFNDISAFFTKSRNTLSPVQYGTVMPLGNASVITVEYMSRLYDLGGDMFNSDGLCILDSEKAAEALRNFKEAFQYSCSTADDSWWNLSAQYFAEGKAAQIIIFINYATDIINSRTSKVLGNIGCGAVPGNHPAVGGGTLGISKYSQKIDESIEFLKWVSNEETTTAFSFLGGVAPYESIFLNNRLLSLYPWLTAARNGIINGSTKRLLDRSNTTVEERKINHILGMAIKNYLHNITDETETLHQAKSSIDRFMAPYLKSMKY